MTNPPPFPDRPPPPGGVPGQPARSGPLPPPPAYAEASQPGGPEKPTRSLPWWVALVVGLGALLVGAGIGAAGSSGDVSDLEDENAQLEDDLAAARGQADDASADNGEQTALADRNDELASQNAALEGEIDDLEGDVASLTAERDELRGQVDELVANQPPPPPPPPETLHFEGTGATVVNLPTPITRGEYTIAHSGARNFAIWALDDTGGRIDLIVNEIGSYTGTVVAGSDFGIGQTSKLEVEADGYWTIDIVVLD